MTVVPVLSAGFGEGHNAAARAVADAKTELGKASSAQLEAFEQAIASSRTQTMQAIGAVREVLVERGLVAAGEVVVFVSAHSTLAHEHINFVHVERV